MSSGVTIKTGTPASVALSTRTRIAAISGGRCGATAAALCAAAAFQAAGDCGIWFHVAGKGAAMRACRAGLTVSGTGRKRVGSCRPGDPAVGAGIGAARAAAPDAMAARDDVSAARRRIGKGMTASWWRCGQAGSIYAARSATIGRSAQTQKSQSWPNRSILVCSPRSQACQNSAGSKAPCADWATSLILMPRCHE